jgi:hypothetical protein
MCRAVVSRKRGIYDVFLLNEFFASRMADEGHGLMYGG